MSTRDHGAVATSAKTPSRRTRVNPFLLVVLTALWVALWGELNVYNVVAGLLVAVGVQVLLPLPPLRIDGRVHPVALTAFLVGFVWQTLVASVVVARHVLSLRTTPRNAVMEVDLRSESDFILTLVAIVTSLIPGSVVVEARRSTHSLFIHALGVDDDEAVERERERVLRTEEQLIRAFGQTITPREPS
ncbi:Na+/H+ antiporter subunit E [Janibacter melonis]|uniref:Na+/H+ antiporter subunit E n=1 Tax=Janibacter melonis TaxID=262209 RepID=A0A5P8FJS3_9MICO|nr:Na+/H+ antiporter subunit E [Janibacter melonis]MCM3554150.1 Na+/H+ antiporter subunit E [Janibacter melonis]QFQ29756.1 Na+/H+ antiporter subunit E [Janibacter melonis]